MPPSPSAGLTQLPASARTGNTHTQYSWVADRDANRARGGRERVSADGRGPDHIGVTVADRAILVTGDRGASAALAQAFADQGDMRSLSPRFLHVQRTVIVMESVNEGLVFCDREETFR